jgi:hypothetical protein
MIAGEERKKERKKKKYKIRSTSTCIPRVLDCKNLIIGLPKKKKKRKSAIEGACHQTPVRRDGSEVKLGVDVRTGPCRRLYDRVGRDWVGIGLNTRRTDLDGQGRIGGTT